MRRFLLAMPFIVIMACPVWAQQTPSPDDLEAIDRAATILREQGSGNPLLRDLADQAESLAVQQQQQSRPLTLPRKGQLILFVSASLGEEGLRRAFQAASGDPDTTLVFRGALPGETFTQVARRLAALIEDIDPKPNVAIHPKSFRDHHVTLVPTIIEPATGKVIRGTVLAETFRERAKRGTEIDLGTVGPASDIVEPDLTLLIRERLAEINIERRARESVASYWQRAPFIDVPKARKRRVRRLDPTVITENDLRDHERRLLAPAGARINPLAALPFTSRLLIFDGTDPAEREWAKEHIRPDRKTILITSRIDRDVGWPAWKELHQSLGLPVYLLQARFAGRFGLEVTPTMIEASPDGKTLLITEDVPNDRENPS
ncbi:MAG: TrbC family F-type conjugative pilus assembly protein [Alphaproteobacteria bacterium]